MITHCYSLRIFQEIKDEVNKVLLEGNVSVLSVSPKGEIKEFDLKTQGNPPAEQSSLRRRSSTRALNRTISRLVSIKESDVEPIDPYGIPVQCNNVQCIFEFRVFRYIGRYGNENPPPANGSLIPSNDSSSSEQVFIEQNMV